MVLKKTIDHIEMFCYLALKKRKKVLVLQYPNLFITVNKIYTRKLCC